MFCKSNTSIPSSEDWDAALTADDVSTLVKSVPKGKELAGIQGAHKGQLVYIDREHPGFSARAVASARRAGLEVKDDTLVALRHEVSQLRSITRAKLEEIEHGLASVRAAAYNPDQVTARFQSDLQAISSELRTIQNLSPHWIEVNNRTLQVAEAVRALQAWMKRTDARLDYCIDAALSYNQEKARAIIIDEETQAREIVHAQAKRGRAAARDAWYARVQKEAKQRDDSWCALM